MTPCARNSTHSIVPFSLHHRHQARTRKWRVSKVGCRKSRVARSVVFKETLSGIRDRVDGALAVSLIGLDGIAIESINDANVPLDVLGAEFGGFIKSIRPNAELNTGDVLQFTLVTEKYIIFLSAITPEYFVLLVMKPDGNYGRARFELTQANTALASELSCKDRRLEFTGSGVI